MDLLRSCYTTFMRFTKDGPAVKVKWYWCPVGAQPYDHHHRFASLIWEKRDEIPLEDTGAIGEVPGAPRQYSKGETPEGVVGQAPCGPEQWFFEGAPADAPPLPRRADGVATCCLLGFEGGINVHGRWVADGDDGPWWLFVGALVGLDDGQVVYNRRSEVGGVETGGFSQVEIVS